MYIIQLKELVHVQQIRYMYRHSQLDIPTCTEQFDQCMSEDRPGYNNHCYYDPQGTVIILMEW